MRGVTLYFKVHEPWRIQEYTVFDMAINHDYFASSAKSDQDNGSVFRKLSQRTYLPFSRLLEELLSQYPGFHFSLGISGTFLEQAEQFDLELLDNFRRLVATGRVELVAEPYYQGLTFLYSQTDFEAQVRQQQQKIRDVFGVETSVFANSELAYNDQVAKWADEAGFKGILAEGWQSILDWRSPNYVYRPVETQQIGLLLNNYSLVNDLALRFNDSTWNEQPLTADKYCRWLTEATTEAPLVNLFFNFKVFGEYQSANSGIFDFFEHFVAKWLDGDQNRFYTVSQALELDELRHELSSPETITWSGVNRDLSVWLGNEMQTEAVNYLFGLEEKVINSGQSDIIEDWHRLQATDTFRHMSLDRGLKQRLDPHYSPYDAFLFFLNIARDLKWRTENFSNKGEDE